MSDQYGRSRSQKGGDNGSPVHAKPGELRPSPRQQVNNSGEATQYRLASGSGGVWYFQAEEPPDDMDEFDMVMADDYDRLKEHAEALAGALKHLQTFADTASQWNLAEATLATYRKEYGDG